MKFLRALLFVFLIETIAFGSSTTIKQIDQISPSGSTLSVSSTRITNVVDPTSVQDAATKNYVDTQLLQLNPAAAVYAASTANIAGTYTNAVSGICIGDTFTTTSTATFTVDGQTPTISSGSNRVLFKNQTSSFQNGVWVLTTAAVPGVSGAIFTRATDSDSSSDLNSGQIVPIANGTINAGSSYYQTSVNTTCNTSTQTWTLFQNAASSYLSSTLPSGDLFVGNASNIATGVALSGDATISNTGAITLATVTSNKGGTGVANPAAHQIPVAQGSNAFNFLSPSTAGSVLTSNGTGSDPTFQALGTISSTAMMVAQASPTATVTSSYSTVKFTSTPTFDTANGYSTSTGNYTVPTTGYYYVVGSLSWNYTATLDNGMKIGIAQNGTVSYINGSFVDTSVTGQDYMANVSAILYANSGDTIAIQTKTAGATFNNFTSDVTRNFFGVQLVATTTSLNASARYTYTGTDAVNTSATIVKFNTQTFDTDSAYSTSTGLFTVPAGKGGKYQVTYFLQMSGTPTSINQGFYPPLYKNGSVYSYPAIASAYSTSGSNQFNISATDVVNCSAGDTLAIYSQRDAGFSGTPALSGSTAILNIERIGN